MIDLHAHVLPAMDDGPSGVEQALSMARVARADGIVSLVATPHVIKGTYDNDRETILRAVDDLNGELHRQGIELKVHPGAEYMLNPDLPQWLSEGRALTINDGGKYLLVEFPPSGIPPYSQRTLYEIALQGVIPVIAHPERNADFVSRPDLLAPFLERGAICQVTAGSLTGFFGRQSRRVGWYFLKRGMCHLIGSDAHSEAHRAPLLSGAARAAAKALGSHFSELQTCGNPGRILKGMPVVKPAGVQTSTSIITMITNWVREGI